MSTRSDTGQRRYGDTETRGRGLRVSLILAVCLVILTGCRMDMQDQPRYEAFEKDSIRQPVDGTVPRGALKDDRELYTGKKDQAGMTGTPQTQRGPQEQGAQNASVPAAALYPDAVEVFPFPVTEAIVRRGRERYDIFCAMCHGATGYGDGMIVKRGFRRPPSYHTDALRQAPVGHIYDVITNGWGSMPAYSTMIPVTDRWAIVAYVRALQLSQNPPMTAATTAPSTAQSPNNGSPNQGNAQPEGQR